MQEKLKKITMKKMIKLGVFLSGLALIVLMTLFNIGVNEEFDLFDWLSHTLIILGIMVFGLLLGESIGKDKQMEKIGGLYQNALKNYNEFMGAIKDKIVFFPAFYEWYLPQDLEKKKINYLVMANVKPGKARKIVKYCELSDLEELTKNPIKKNAGGKEVIIGKLDEHEIPPVTDILTGKIRIEAPGASYYLSAFGGASTRGVLENGRMIDKQIKFNKNSNRILKLMISALVSLAWGALTITEMSSGDGSAQMMAWFNLLSRLCALLTSLTSGWSSSVITVKLEAEKMDDKRKILEIFDDCIAKGLFIPRSEEETDRMEYESFILAQKRHCEDETPESKMKESEEGSGNAEETDGT